MAFSHRTDLLKVEDVVHTKEMTMKVIKARKQECKSRIVLARQAIQDLQIAKVSELEYTVLQAEAELEKLEKHEKLVIASVDTPPVK